MDNLRKFILQENVAAGAVSSGAIAANPWGGAPARNKKPAKKKLPIAVKKGHLHQVRTNESLLQQLLEFDVDPDFDPAEVVSRLKATEKKSNTENDDTVAFGLEDSNNNVVKVYVRTDQASDFEKSLQQILNGDSDKEDFDGEAGEAPDVAEVLYNLKDKFDIVDVVWPDDQEDEEEPATQGVAGGENVEGDTGEQGGLETELTLDDGGEGDLTGEEDLDLTGGEDEMSAGTDTDSALQQMIKMMQSDAEARKAEAEAKRAEAEADKAKYAAQAAESKLKQEEQVLDMEAYYKNKKSMDDESKTLAKLAKWKHEMSQDVGGNDLGFAEEEEERVVQDIKDSGGHVVPQAKVAGANTGKMTTQEIFDELYKRLRVQV